MKPLSNTLLSCCGHCVHASVHQLRTQEPDDTLGGYDVYWTSDGLLLLRDPDTEEEDYFLSHSDTHFVLDPKTMRIGIRPKPHSETWALPLCNMVSALLSRTILDKSEVPRCSRLVRMAEEPLHMVKRKVETSWIIS